MLSQPWERYAARVHAYGSASPPTRSSPSSPLPRCGASRCSASRATCMSSIPTGPPRRGMGDVVVHTSSGRSGDRAARGPLHDLRRAHRTRTRSSHAARVRSRGLRRLREKARGCRARRAHCARTHPGRTSAAGGGCAWLHRRSDAASESTGESVSRAVIEWLGFDDPEVQFQFRHEGNWTARDFFWLDRRRDRRVRWIRQVRRTDACRR